MMVVAEIVRVSDGVVAEDHEVWDEGLDPIYMWTEGNYGCDCNRHLFFERANGREPDEAEDRCSRGRYQVRLKIDGDIALDEWRMP